MGLITKVQWCDHTFSPWHGCEKVSAGCKFCYASVSTPVRVKRARGLELWGPAKTTRRSRTAQSTWKNVRAWNRAAREQREHAEAKGEAYTRPRVFPSLCDPFEDHSDANAIRPDFFGLIMETQEFDWLLLTKRPENVRSMAPDSMIKKWPLGIKGYREPRGDWPHVKIGASVEDQKTANARIPHLLGLPGSFLSIEPLLGPVDLTIGETLGPSPLPSNRNGSCSRCGLSWSHQDTRSASVVAGSRRHRCPPGFEGENLSWIIIGGESGPNARVCEVDWIKSLVRQAQAAGVPAFVKQLGACALDERNGLAGHSLFVADDVRGLVKTRLVDPKGGDPEEWEPSLRVREQPSFCA